MKKCCHCHETKPYSEFHSSKAHGGYAPRCKPCAIDVASSWYFANKERKRAYDAKRRKDKRHLFRGASKRWRDSNPQKKNADTNSRRRRLKECMPKWMSPSLMKCFYEQAQRVTQCTGVPHHVDHVIPLHGRKVSGLHVPWNLQVIPAFKNLSKGNSMRHGGIA